MKIYRVTFRCFLHEAVSECFCRDEFGLTRFLKTKKFGDIDINSVVRGFRWAMENMNTPYLYDDGGYTMVSVEQKNVW
jgi:hypothetical protein